MEKAGKNGHGLHGRRIQELDGRKGLRD